MEDCCAVCAEPLDWVAYGTCGHKDACSKCVTRLRFVLKDNRCVICQQTLQYVFVTRYLGNYTKSISAQEFSELQSNGGRPQYHFLRAVEAFFDDKGHFEAMRQLCSYTHPALAGVTVDGESQASHYRSLGALKKAVQTHLQQQFCNVCLESRKVFIPEQILYSKPDLHRHQRTGDIEGAMAESGFRGHPMCRFCNKFFFGENELFLHMQHGHEQCHICKKANPDRFVYYKDYNELEAHRTEEGLSSAEHFRHEHYLCGHSECLEKKFVVFTSEQELKQHTAREHGGGMSRAERRQALTIPIDITYSRHRAEEAIGARRGRGGPVRFREPDPSQLATALQESVDSAAKHREAAQREAQRQQAGNDGGDRVHILDDSEFPSMGNGEAPAFGPGFGAFAQRTAPRPDEFPALPGTSKHAKKRAKEKEKEQEARSLASRVGRQGEIRVLSSGRAQEDASGRREESFPALNSTAGRPNGTSHTPGPPQWQSKAATKPSAPTQKVAGDDFPSLPQHQRRPQIQVPNFPEVRAAPPSDSARTATQSAQTAKPSSGGDFPALNQVPFNGAAPPTRGAATLRPEDPAVSPSGGVSEALKAANKVLVEKVKKQLDAKRFAEFRQSIAAFMRGDADAQIYHKTVEQLGLAHLVPEMASLLPDPSKRAALLAAHEQAASTSSRYVPPEAAAAAVRAARSHGSWECPTCTLINEPRAANCEACHSKRPLQSLGSLSRPTSQQPVADGTAAEHGSTKDSKQQKKIPKFEKLRLTSGGQEGSFRDEIDRRTKPQNVWTQRQTTTSGKPQAPSQKSAWGNEGGAKLASNISAVQQAWAKK